jgi:hypothetical protein
MQVHSPEVVPDLTPIHDAPCVGDGRFYPCIMHPLLITGLKSDPDKDMVMAPASLEV